MKFAAIDVETANADMSSICQIGIAKFIDDSLDSEWSSLINPEDYFDPMNVFIHGITENKIIDAPKINDVAQDLYDLLDGVVTVCHTHFDRVSIGKAFAKYDIRSPEPMWLDTAKVARRTWSEVSWSGYGLKNVCKMIGYEFKHHDALEDAKASGQILIAAMQKTGLELEGWFERVNQAVDLSIAGDGKISREGNPEGEFYGENLVFTGALEIPRREAATKAAQMGCNIQSGVTKKTTMLVVGDQDVTRLAGKDKSSKHRKAEGLIEKGQEIRILRESDFKTLVEQVQT